MLDFEEEGKAGVPGLKTLRAKMRTKNKLDPHMRLHCSPGIKHGPHWWEASALTISPSLLPLHCICGSLKQYSQTQCSCVLFCKLP